MDMQASPMKSWLAAAGLSVVAAVTAASSPARADDQADLIARGKYLVTAADCMPCHTGPGRKPFTGGLPINTPFGVLTTPNITPDKATGIGNWTDAQFYGALHDGIGAHGEFLYPVFPFTSFTKITPDDVKAIKAYLFTLPPETAPPQQNNLRFPFNVRQSLAVWREMFFTPGTFEPNPKASDQINRGAYLVEALGHCAECHTPRNIMGAMEPSKELAGGTVDTFFAPNISSDLRSGVGGWSNDQLFQYLKTGATQAKGVVFGPMAEVVHDSLSKLTDDDLHAIVAYLKATPDEVATTKAQPDERRHAGAVVYLNVCSQCHQTGGTGIPNAIPALAGNGAVQAGEPNDVISAVIGGLKGKGSYGNMPSFASALTDQQIVDVVNYVRTSWGNKGSANATLATVASIRSGITTTDLGTEAAQKLDCPRVSSDDIAGTLSNPGSGILTMLQGIKSNGGGGSQVPVLINEIRQASPGISDAQLVDDTIAAFCPIVAQDTAMSEVEKKQVVDAFAAQVNTEVMANALPTGAKVFVSVPLPQSVLTGAEAAAQAAGENRDIWLEKAIADQVKASGK